MRQVRRSARTLYATAGTWSAVACRTSGILRVEMPDSGCRGRRNHSLRYLHRLSAIETKEVQSRCAATAGYDVGSNPSAAARRVSLMRGGPIRDRVREAHLGHEPRRRRAYLSRPTRRRARRLSPAGAPRSTRTAGRPGEVWGRAPPRGAARGRVGGAVVGDLDEADLHPTHRLHPVPAIQGGGCVSRTHSIRCSGGSSSSSPITTLGAKTASASMVTRDN
jgi:hypothetical protein